MTLTEGEKKISDIQRKAALVDHINLIPAFSGELGSVSYADFKQSFERLAGLYEWDEKEKIFVLFTRVIGPAAQLLRNYEKENKTFDQLCEILESRYAVKDSPAIALQKFLTFKQGPGMSVQEFFDKATHLSLSALVVNGGDDTIINRTRTEMLKTMLLNNLSPEIKKGVIARDPTNPTEILKYALLEEKSWKAVRVEPVSHALLTMPSSSAYEQGANQLACAAARADKRERSELDELKEQVKLLTAQMAELVNLNSQVNSNRREVSCFKCSLSGHIARFCPNYYNQRNNYHNQREYESGFGRSNSGFTGESQTNYGGNRGQRGNYRGNRGQQNNYRGNRGHQSNYRANQGHHNNPRNDTEESNKNAGQDDEVKHEVNKANGDNLNG